MDQPPKDEVESGGAEAPQAEDRVEAAFRSYGLGATASGATFLVGFVLTVGILSSSTLAPPALGTLIWLPALTFGLGGVLFAVASLRFAAQVLLAPRGERTLGESFRAAGWRRAEWLSLALALLGTLGTVGLFAGGAPSHGHDHDDPYHLQQCGQPPIDPYGLLRGSSGAPAN